MSKRQPSRSTVRLIPPTTASASRMVARHARLAELVGRGEPGRAGADDDDPVASACAAGSDVLSDSDMGSSIMDRVSRGCEWGPETPQLRSHERGPLTDTERPLAVPGRPTRPATPAGRGRRVEAVRRRGRGRRGSSCASDPLAPVARRGADASTSPACRSATSPPRCATTATRRCTTCCSTAGCACSAQATSPCGRCRGCSAVATLPLAWLAGRRLAARRGAWAVARAARAVAVRAPLRHRDPHVLAASCCSCSPATCSSTHALEARDRLAAGRAWPS